MTNPTQALDAIEHAFYRLVEESERVIADYEDTVGVEVTGTPIRIIQEGKQALAHLATLRQQVDELTTQLATAQAQAKALEECCNKQQDYLNYIAGSGDAEAILIKAASEACTIPKPQPVDAASLQRIAILAQIAIERDELPPNNPTKADSLYLEFVITKEALTDADRALIETLAKGVG